MRRDYLSTFNIQQFRNQLYNLSKVKVNALYYELFYRKIKNQKKFVHMSILRRCKKMSRLHTVRSVYIAGLRKRKNISKPECSGVRL